MTMTMSYNNIIINKFTATSTSLDNVKAYITISINNDRESYQRQQPLKAFYHNATNSQMHHHSSLVVWGGGDCPYRPPWIRHWSGDSNPEKFRIPALL